MHVLTKILDLNKHGWDTPQTRQTHKCRHTKDCKVLLWMAIALAWTVQPAPPHRMPVRISDLSLLMVMQAMRLHDHSTQKCLLYTYKLSALLKTHKMI